MCQKLITIQPIGRSFAAEPGESILQAAIRHRAGLPYGCRDGACGSCRCRLLEGRVEQGPHQPGALGESERSDGFILACCSVALTDVVLESPHAVGGEAPVVRKMVARVASLKKVSADVMEVGLQLPPGSFDHYRAGQYLDVVLRDGARRSYSMANAPGEQSRAELHIRHMPGGRFTDHVFGAMKEREILRVEGPYGSFFLRESSARPIVMLASGTGFAPIKAVLEQIRAAGALRPVALYWGGRRPGDLYRREWIDALRSAWPGLDYVPVVSDALPEDRWQGRTGFVHRAVVDDFPDLSGHQVYACGAPVVVESARAEFVSRCGLPAEEFFADAFTTARDKALPGR